MKSNRLLHTLVAVGLACTSGVARAEGLRFLPILEPGFEFEPTAAIAVGAVRESGNGERTLLNAGLDLIFNCGLVQTPDTRIRTYAKLLDTETAAVRARSLELSPRYTFPIGSAVYVNGGPALAALNVRLADANNGRAAMLFGYGAAAGVEVRQGRFYAGLDVRYLSTTQHDGVKDAGTAVLANIGARF